MSSLTVLYILAERYASFHGLLSESSSTTDPPFALQTRLGASLGTNPVLGTLSSHGLLQIPPLGVD